MDQPFNNIIDKIKGNHNNQFINEFKKSENSIIKTKQQVKSFLRNKPLVSIIMVIDNNTNNHLDSINSVIDQSYVNWELLVCDYSSNNKIEKIIKKLTNNKIKHFKSTKNLESSVRNYGLKKSKGDYVAYLDPNNIWCPEYLSIMVGTMLKNKGYFCAFSKYIATENSHNNYSVKSYKTLKFNYEKLMKKNFVNLNCFIHRRELYENLGGFDEKLVLHAEWDLVLKYVYLRDPIYVDKFLLINQINNEEKQSCDNKENNIKIIKKNLENYFSSGVTCASKKIKKSITIISWDICGNHFSKAYNIAEALSQDYEVQLLGFRFLRGKIFEPYKNEKPSFETTFINGCGFPKFGRVINYALKQIKGDVIYVVKPRMPSLALGLLANYYFSKPIILEFNDLETVLYQPNKSKIDRNFSLKNVNLKDRGLLTPHSLIWVKIMEQFAKKMPATTAHNKNLDAYFDNKSFCIRNLKDERFYDPDIYSREKIRKELGFSSEDRVILFGGVLREHKGVYKLIELMNKLNDKRYKVLFIGSRKSPELENIRRRYKNKVVVLPPQNRNDMAKINYACDLVILWLNPKIPASHYQMPYKLTDAIAMNVPVIANDISDLGDLGRNGYLRVVEYGNFNILIKTIKDIFNNREHTKRITENARRLYLRQFSYKSIKSQFDIIYDIVKKEQVEFLDVSKEFKVFFSKFLKAFTKHTK